MPSNHGHVFPLPSGHKARCGGPALCTICQKDVQELVAAQVASQVETIKPSGAPEPDSFKDLNKDIAALRHNITDMSESFAKLQVANEMLEEAHQALKMAVINLQIALGKAK